jgi:hypothetical protein
MGCYRYSQMFLSVAHCLFVFCVADFRPLVIGGFFKLIASLALACLLAFVVVRLADISQLVAARFHVLPASLFPFVVEQRWVRRSEAMIAVPDEPSLSPLFQRPPPIFSL